MRILRREKGEMGDSERGDRGEGGTGCKEGSTTLDKNFGSVINE